MKYRILKTEEELKGRVIKDVVWGYVEGSMILMFEDDTFVYFKPEIYHDHAQIELMYDFHLGNFDNDQLVEHNFITQAELDTFYKDREKARLEGIEKNEREVYEKLKKKYGTNK